jgi:hypothetical protein
MKINSEQENQAKNSFSDRLNLSISERLKQEKMKFERRHDERAFMRKSGDLQGSKLSLIKEA